MLDAKSIPRPPFAWPPSATRTLIAILFVAFGAASAAREAGRLLVAVGAIALGVGICMYGLWREARLEGEARRILPDEEGQRLSPEERVRRIGEQLEEVRHRLGKTHPATGAPTRDHFLEGLSDELARSQAPGVLGVVRFADFDRMAAFDPKSANAALKVIAERLARASDKRRLIGHIDRDSFGVWLRDDGSVEALAAEFDALAHVAGQEIAEGETVLTPATQRAMLRYPEDGQDAASLLVRATAVLSSKTAAETEGPHAFGPSLSDARDAFELEQDLGRAIQENQLAVVYQPVIDLKAGRILGAEALLRWTHPRLGAISPSRFFPIVEALGLSDRYGIWVLNTACREARIWRDAGHETLKVAVNLSARQLLDPNLKSKIERTLERHRLPPEALELELTETAAMADAGRTLHLFADLRALGISLAVDDFGSGYSSLSYLKNLPFDKLKIDREFVTGVDRRRDSRAICKALVELGMGLDLKILAEGVETLEEVEALTDLGCGIFQGFYFSRPLPAETFRQILASPERLFAPEAQTLGARPSESLVL